MVEGADAEAVVGGVGAARGVPAYVGGLEGEAGVVGHGIPAADGAAVFMGPLILGAAHPIVTVRSCKNWT